MVPVIDLGRQPLANGFLSKKQLGRREEHFPLKVYFCRDCFLSQLTHVVPPEKLFREYVYLAAKMPTASEHWRSYAEEVTRDFADSKTDLVVEIGSNDGALLAEIGRRGVRILGVDPARKIAFAAKARGVPTLAEFWSEKLARKIAKKYGFAKVIIGNNVIAHIDDQHDLFRGIKEVLSSEGVFVFEAPYMADMFDNLAFDSIYHEHLSFFTLRPIIKLAERYDFEVFKVKILPIQGSSIRIYVCRKGARKVDVSVGNIVREEKRRRFDRLDTYRKLSRRIVRRRDELVKIITSLRAKGRSLAAYGAPARGTVLLNYLGIDRRTFLYATEELSTKVGLFTPGVHLPVIDVREARKNPPDYFLLLSWNYRDKILKKERNFLKGGGHFVVPIGSRRII